MRNSHKESLKGPTTQKLEDIEKKNRNVREKKEKERKRKYKGIAFV